MRIEVFGDDGEVFSGHEQAAGTALLNFERVAARAGHDLPDRREFWLAVHDRQRRRNTSVFGRTFTTNFDFEARRPKAEVSGYVTRGGTSAYRVDGEEDGEDEPARVRFRPVGHLSPSEVTVFEE